MKMLLGALLLLGCITDALAINLTKGRGALLYDASFPAGPTSKPTNDAGQWVSNITSFNQGAGSTGLQISRLYPYSGDVELYCSDPNTCISSGAKKNMFVYYGADGQASVAAYRAANPNALILAIIDGSTGSSLLKALTYTEVGTEVAVIAANAICADPNVDGIFFDIEKFDISVPGQFALYKKISELFASSTCMDTRHPNGRTFGVFINPNHVVPGDWPKVAAALGKNGFVSVSAYDVRDVCPPVPVSIQAYTASITGMLQKMDAASIANTIPYTVVIPAAASFSEFNQYGTYDASQPNNFRLIKDFTPEGITQLGYVKAVRAIITATCKSVYYLGEDFWSWGQYKSPPCTAGDMLMPNIPEGAVVQYLQQNGTTAVGMVPGLSKK